MKTVWLSDLHFSVDGPVVEHDTSMRIDAAVDFINRHHADADLCVVTGDLVNRGTGRDYDALHQHLAALACPIYPMVGNHDNRALLRSTFELPQSSMTDFVQYRVDLADSVLLCLDTQRAGADSGEFCTDREHWLEQQLSSTGGKPVFLFMHHPPMALGLPMQDSENLRDSESLLALLAASDDVAYLFIGHVHRPICGVIRGLPFATMRAVSYQAPAPQPAWTWEQFAPAAEAPNLGVITTAGSDVNVQYLQFCDYAYGT